jgi:Ca2+-binding RTX toxin-like protein
VKHHVNKQTPATNAASEFEVLEPRVMLDATGALAWSLSDSTVLDQVDVISSMSALMESFEAEFDADTATGILKILQDRLSEALTGEEDLFYLKDGEADTRFGELADTFERVRIAAQAVVDDYRQDLADLITANLNDVSSAIVNVTATPPPLSNASGVVAALAGLQAPDALDAVVTDMSGSTTGDYESEYLKFDGVYYYQPVITEVKAAIVAGVDPVSGVAIAAEPAEYSYTSFDPVPQVAFDFQALLSTSTSLNNMQGSLDTFDDGLTAQVRAYVAAEAAKIEIGSANFQTSTVGGITNPNKFSNVSVEVAEVDPFFTEPQIDDLAEYFTNVLRSAAHAAVDPEAALDVSDRDYVSVNGVVQVNTDLPAPVAPATTANNGFNLWNYLNSPDVLGQFITQEALFGQDDANNGDPAAVFRGKLLQRIDTFLESLDVQVGDITTDMAGVETIGTLSPFAISTTTKDYIRALWAQKIEETFNNVSDADLADLQRFDGTPNTPAGSLQISVAMPTFDTLLNQLELDGKLRAAIPSSFAFTPTQTELTFDLTPATDLGGATETVDLSINNFALSNGGALFEFGAANDFTGTDHVTTLPVASQTELPMGFLSGQLTSISTGQIGLYTDFQGGGSVDFARALSFDSTAFAADKALNDAAVTASGDDFSFEARAQAVGDNTVRVLDLQSAASLATPLDLVRYDLIASLPLTFGTTGAVSSATSFDVELTQSVVLNELSFITDNFDTIFNGTSVQFDVPGLGSGGETVGDIGEALFYASPLMIGEFFDDLGRGMQDLLTQDDFSVKVPLTDIDLADAFQGIADVFAEIDGLFDIAPDDLGFVQTSAEGNVGQSGQAPSFLIGPDITSQAGISLNTAEIAKLAALGSITFETYSYNEADEYYDTPITRTLDLSALTPLDDYSDVIDPGQFLADFVAAFNTDLAALGWSAQVSGKALTLFVTPPVGGGVPSPLPSGIAITGAVSRDTTATSITLKDLGFRDAQKQTLTLHTGTTVEALMVQDGVESVDLGAIDIGTLKTMDTVRFVIAVDGVFQTVDVMKPDMGWGYDPLSPNAAITDANVLSDFVDQFNDALGNFNIDMTVSQNANGDGLNFATDNATSSQTIQIALDPEALTRAFSMKGLVHWMQEAFGKIDCMPEFEVTADVDTGDIQIGFTTPFTKDVTQNKALDIGTLELGPLQDLNLQATMSATIAAAVDITAGFNIIDMQTQYKNTYDVDQDGTLDETEQEAFENNTGFADKIPQVVSDNTYLTDLKLNAVLDADVSAFQGEASMGMVGIGIGTDPAGTSSLNFARMNTELVIDLVGQSDSVFSDRISGTQLKSLAGQTTLQGYQEPGAAAGAQLVETTAQYTRTYEDPNVTTYPDGSGGTRAGDDTRLLSLVSDNATPLDTADDITYTVQRDPATDKITGYLSDEGTPGNLADDVTITDLPVYTPVYGVDTSAGTRFVDLLGKVELIGGILVDADGCAVEIDTGAGTPITSDDTFQVNETLTSAADLVIHNGEDRLDTLPAGYSYSMLHLNFEQPELHIGDMTIGGSNSGFSNAKMQLTVGDLFDLPNTTQLCTDLDKLLCLALVDPNLLVEGVAGFGLLLEGFVDNLQKNFPVLNTTVPLLNGTLLEQLDFLGDFNDGMAKLQAQGGITFATINSVFEDAFGPGVLTLNLKTEEPALPSGPAPDPVCELELSLNLNFLENLKLTEAFNLSLSALMGEDGLSQLLQSTGATELEGVFSSLVDARGDAELVIDPGLIFDFHLGIDLLALKASASGGNLQNDVSDATDINRLNTGPMLTTNGLGSVDLRIDWADADIDLTDTTVDAGTGDTVPVITPGAFSLLLDFDKIKQDATTADGDDILTVGELVTAMNANLADLVATMSEPLKSRVDGNVSIAFVTDQVTDPDTGVVTEVKTFKLIDTLSDARAPEGVTALFGGDQSAPASDHVAPTMSTPYAPRSFDVTTTDYADAFTFAIKVGDGAAVDIAIAAETGRTKEQFIEAFNSVLLDISIKRDQISDTALIASTIPLSQLFAVSEVDVMGTPTVQLRTTNFAQNSGYDEFSVQIIGNDISHDVTFTVTEEDNSNAARIMGFGTGVLFDGEAIFEGNAVSKTLLRSDTVDVPILYLDTAKTKIAAELGVGVPGGLNVIVNLGPFEASIENGSIFIGASGEGQERGYIKGTIADIDNNTADGRYDLLNLYTLSQEENPDYLKLFGLDVDFETRVDLPFSGAFGLLDPSQHGFEYISTLLRTEGTAAGEGDLTVIASDIATAFDDAETAKGSALNAQERIDALLPFFRGDAKEIYRASLAAAGIGQPPANTSEDNAKAAAKILAPLSLTFTPKPTGSPYDANGALVNTAYFSPNTTPDSTLSASLTDLGAETLGFGPHYVALKLPSLPDCGDLLDLINDPLAVVNGLDMILGTIQDFVTEALSDIDLPVVGTNLMQGAQFFSDLRYDVIDGARTYLENPIDTDNDPSTPDERPTTLDLVNTYMNDAFASSIGTVLGTDTARFQLDVFDNSADPDSHAALYGGFVLDFIVFNEDLDVGFNLDIPGLNLAVDDASTLNFQSRLNLELAFGLDCNGFFVLNKYDDGTDPTFTPEGALTITASAGEDFTASMNIGGVLDVTAMTGKAADLAAGTAETGFLISTDNPKTATEVEAALTLDLFGAAGFDQTSGDGPETRTYTFTESALQPLGLATTAAEFNRMVYLSQIDFNDFADIGVTVDIRVDLDLKADMKVDGVSLVPTLLTDFIFDATYDPLVNAKDLKITAFEFHKISIDTSSMQSVLDPILAPIISVVDPIKSLIDVMDVAPMSFFIDAFQSAFPIFGVIDQIDNIRNAVGGLNAQICIGDYDFVGNSQVETSSTNATQIKGVWLSDFKIANAIFRPCIDFDYSFSLDASAQGPGVTLKIPILQDPSNALNLLLGRFDKVDLARVEVNLLSAKANLDIAGQVLSNVGLPSWASSAIRGGFNANIDAEFKAALEFGYDLSGIVNFANTLDAERLLDGIFIDPNLVYANITGSMGVSAYIAGASGYVSGLIDLDIRDPNEDGKIRLPELLFNIEKFETENSLEGKLGALFAGTTSLSAGLSLWAGINLPWPLPDLSWSTSLFSGEIFSYTLPAPAKTPKLVTDLSGTQFVMLNAGAQAGANLTSLDFDGDDNITVSGGASGSTVYNVSYSSNGQAYTGGNTSFNNNQLIIAAGEGTNTVNLAGMANAATTITYLGDGNDTITLADSGVHVVFAGGGNDTITIGTSGTYYIFGEGGADNITASGDLTNTANVTIFADNDYGMRDYFKKTFVDGGSVTAAAMETALAANFKISRDTSTLANLEDNYTRVSQTTAGRDAETITLAGGGNVTVFTGAGDDVITLDQDQNSNAKIYAGAGDDVITSSANGTVNGNTTIEGGAGSDLIVLEGTGQNLVYGWGAQGENTDYAREARLFEDNDLIIGGSGMDTFFGQYGRDILSGQAGDDSISAGPDDDIVSGGILQVFKVDANGDKVPGGLDLTTPGILAQLDTTLIVETDTAASDGNDNLSGDAGSDVLLGGSGSDTLVGGASPDILVGDYGQISVSSNRIAQTFTSTGVDQSGGTDSLDGGASNDILVGGAGTSTEVFVDTLGNNIVLGDFGIVEGNRILETVTAYRSIASTTGGDDSITTGAGNDVIIGGEGNDTINGGAGGDAIIGDLGSFVPSDGTMTNAYYDIAGNLLSNTTAGNPAANEGNDVISLGLDGTGTAIISDLFDIVLAGGGSDMISGGTGGMVVIGDYGNISLNSDSVRTLFTFIPLESPPADTDTSDQAVAYRERIKEIERIFQSVSSLDTGGNPLGDTRSGNDSITTIGGTVFSVLGGGADSVDLGNGLSYIVTDDGEMAITRTPVGGVAPEFGTVTGFSISTALAGADTVTTRQGRDIIITGDGNDTINAGDDLNFVLTDNGSLETSDDTNALPDFLKNTDGAGDGNDSYTGGTGTDYVIMGGGSDIGDGGTGRNFILGDSGIMEFTATAPSGYTATLTSNDIAPAHFDGDDTILGGDGENFVIAGLGNADKSAEDVITFGNGNNTIMANAGSFTYTLDAAGNETIVSTVKPVTTIDQDGNDSITTGSGRDVVALGLGNDTAQLGGGNNFALGGAGRIELGLAASGASTVRMTSEALSTIARDGNDTITTGAGRDVVALGMGGDTAHLGDGNNFALGGAGDIELAVTATGDETIRLTAQDLSAIAQDGDDTITTGTGRDVVALGMGGDTATLGEGNNFALGGAGEIELALQTNGAQTIRLTAADISTIAQDGNDTVTTGAGRDVVALGLGGDTATLGEGNNFALGGAGEVALSITAAGDETIRLTSAAVSAIAQDGNDTITTGAGRDVIALGLGSDSASLSDGINFALGDAGEINLALNANGAQTINIASAVTSTIAQDGNDTVNTGDNDDFIVLGLGADTGNFGNGRAFGVGSDGTVTYEQAAGTTAFEFEIQSNAIIGTLFDGNDTINAVNGNDYIVLGLGDDLANVGDGRNRVVGDQGRISGGPLSDVEELQSTYLDLGGNDQVSSGKDEDIFVLGQGAELANSGAGDDIIVGDNAHIIRTGTPGLHSLQVYTTGGGGNDTLSGSAGNDIVIGALGADVLHGGTGEDFLLGDLGDLTFRNDTDVSTLTYTTLDVGGDDLLTATGAGDNIMIGQAGADTLSGGADDDIMIGDLATLTLTDVRNAQPGQSALDRLSTLEFIGTNLIFDDLLNGNAGVDMMIGGFGADTLNGGTGQDFLFGDTIMVKRTLSAGNFEIMEMDTNFAYLTGGTDNLDGGTGNNIVVGGLGTDLFFGNTQSQVLAGDAFTALTHASFANGFTGETPNRALQTVNFAGPYEVDLLTFSQLEESMGVYFSAGAPKDAVFQNGYRAFVHSDQMPALAAYDPITLAHVTAFFEQDSTITTLADLIYFGADSVLITEEMLRLLALFGGQANISTDADEFYLFKLLLQRILNDLNTPDAEPARIDQETAAPAPQTPEPAASAHLDQHEIAVLQSVI